MQMIDHNQKHYLNENFDNISFAEGQISLVEFDNCQFTSCNFSQTQFIKCKFYECKFINCNLSLIKVTGCSFFDIVFEETKAIGINWTQATWPKIKLSNPLKFYKCALNDSSFFGLSLREIIMVECNAENVDFREADCEEANFSQTNFAASLFRKTNLTRANFTDAINYNIDIFTNNIKKAKFCLPEAVNLLNCLDIELSD